jgi:hypothetical protein
MESNVSCGDCDFFVDKVQRHLGDLLARYEFRSVQCEADRGGRECTWMLESHRCRLLFTLSDGAEDCSIGKVDTPFPGKVSFYLNGELGWYNTLWLIELRAGKQLLTRKLIKRLWQGELEYLAWLAPLLEQWMPELIGMFDLQAELTWHDDLLRMLEGRKPG